MQAIQEGVTSHKTSVETIKSMLSIYLAKDMHESEKRAAIFDTYSEDEISDMKDVVRILQNGRPDVCSYSYDEINEVHLFLHKMAENGISSYPSLVDPEQDSWMHNHDCEGFDKDEGKCIMNHDNDASYDEAAESDMSGDESIFIESLYAMI